MRIQKQRKDGAWVVLVEGSLQRTMSDWGKFIYEITASTSLGAPSIVYRMTLDARDLEKINRRTRE